MAEVVTMEIPYKKFRILEEITDSICVVREPGAPPLEIIIETLLRKYKWLLDSPRNKIFLFDLRAEQGKTPYIEDQALKTLLEYRDRFRLDEFKSGAPNTRFFVSKGPFLKSFIWYTNMWCRLLLDRDALENALKHDVVWSVATMATGIEVLFLLPHPVCCLFPTEYKQVFVGGEPILSLGTDGVIYGSNHAFFRAINLILAGHHTDMAKKYIDIALKRGIDAAVSLLASDDYLNYIMGDRLEEALGEEQW